MQTAQSRLNITAPVEVCIVGAGHAGRAASTAMRAYPWLKVTVLEQHAAGK